MKALIVDDDEMVRLALGSLLKTSFLCRVIEADNGLDAMALIESETPDICRMFARFASGKVVFLSGRGHR